MTNPVNVEVPEGSFDRYRLEDKSVKVVAILDHHGEIFLLDKLSRSVYRAHKTRVPSYFRYLAPGVDNYINLDPRTGFFVIILAKPVIISPPPQNEEMRHPWLVDTHAVIQLITTLSDFIEGNSDREQYVDQIFREHKVFEKPWNKVLSDKFVKERVLARASIYSFNKGSSLLRITRNEFNHHDDDVKEEVGETKEKMLGYFRGKFSKLVLASYKVEKVIHNVGLAHNLKIFYEGNLNSR